MKTVRAALQTKLDNGSTQFIECGRIELTNGTTHYFTNYIKDIEIGGNTYLGNTGYAPTAMLQTDDPSGDSIDVEGILTALGVTRSDIQSGIYDNARVYVFLTDWSDPVEDDFKKQTGFWGKCVMQRYQWKTEFISLAERLNQAQGRTYGITCDWDLGSTECGVNLTPSTWAVTSPLTVWEATESGDASVGDLVKPITQSGLWHKCTTGGTQGTSEPSWTSSVGGTTNDGSAVFTAIRAYTFDDAVDIVTDRRNFSAASLEIFDEGWFDYGVVTFTSGDNNGYQSEVKLFTNPSPNPGHVELLDPMPFTIQVSDTFTIQAGCKKRLEEDCNDKFDNRYPHGGFTLIPTVTETGKFGGQ